MQDDFTSMATEIKYEVDKKLQSEQPPLPTRKLQNNELGDSDDEEC